MKKANALFLCLAALVCCAALCWEHVTPDVAIQLPQDMAPHPTFQSEWWYAAGELSAGEGRPYGVQWTLFRTGLDDSPATPGASTLRPRQVLSANLGIADFAARTFQSAQRVRRAAGGLAGWSQDGRRVWLEDWSITSESDGTLHLAAEDAEKGLAVDLALRPLRRPILQGDNGWSRKGPEPGNASAYFSLSRCAAHGTLTVGGSRLAVSGEMWFDKEWGTTQLGKGLAGWDWFGLRLQDGRDLMLYRLRTAQGGSSEWSSGTLVSADGTSRRLCASDFETLPRSPWRSPRTGASYPVRWRLRVPSAGIECEVTAPVEGAEIDGSHSVGTFYWEGPVIVSGSVAGRGYAELTGYAGPLAQAF